MSDLYQQLEALNEEARAALDSASSTEETEAWHSTYVSRKGKLTGLLRGLGQLSKDERPLVGKRANEIKVALESAFSERQDAIAHAEMESALSAEGIDVTLPGRPVSMGGLHPTTTAMREITDIFSTMGFQVYDAPEVETDDYNFTLFLDLPGFTPDYRLVDLAGLYREDEIVEWAVLPS